MSAHGKSKRPAPDQLFVDIAKYVTRKTVGTRAAYLTARYCLMDAISCALDALDSPECMSLVGPLVPGATMKGGARVPGTRLELDPVAAAFNTGCLIRWLDFNDTWWAGGHPSDNYSAILSVADYVSRARIAARQKPLSMVEALTAAIQAYEIQGVLAMGTDFDDIGLDHVMLIKMASAAVCTRLLGGSVAQIVSAVSNAVIEGGTLVTYRKSPNSGPRKSWAAGDATSRAVRLALLALRGEIGYPTALSVKTWGFNDVLNRGEPLKVPRAFGSYVIENIRYKIAFPAQRHAQTGAECAARLHPKVQGRVNDIEKIVVHTHKVTLSKICATGPLNTAAARDHSLQYIIAVGLIFGDITGTSYEDEFAADPRIDQVRGKMKVVEDPRYTHGFNSADRSDANSVQVFFKDDTKTERLEILYLLGDPKRRKEGLPLLERKFKNSLARRFSPARQRMIWNMVSNQSRLEKTPVSDFMSLLVEETAKGARNRSAK